MNNKRKKKKESKDPFLSIFKNFSGDSYNPKFIILRFICNLKYAPKYVDRQPS